MIDPAREIESKALELPPMERARLAERLLLSLETEADPDAERLWLEEAERRLEELRSGNVAGIPVPNRDRAEESISPSLVDSASLTISNTPLSVTKETRTPPGVARGGQA